MQNQEVKKLYRSRKNKIIAGICGGFGEYFNLDPLIFRIIFIVLVLADGIGILIYIILFFLMPAEAEIVQEQNTVRQPEHIAEIIKDRADEIKYEIKTREDFFNAKNLIGFVLILFAISLLLRQYIPFGMINWQTTASLLLIIFALIIIFKK